MRSMRGTPRHGLRQRRGQVSGATLAEFVVAVPTLLMLIMAVLQAAFAFHAKSQLNYATVEAARAGTMNNASMDSMANAFRKAMIGYYGGGTTEAKLAASAARAATDLVGSVRIEVISPSTESFADYNSPQLQAQLKTSKRVIPNDNLGEVSCPPDVPAANCDYKKNTSNQTLADANLLKLRVTYGIPQAKQMPLVGRFYTWALSKLTPVDTDLFRGSLVEAGRIPLVTHVTMRMQSAAIEDLNSSQPTKGNDGTAKDPGSAPAQLPLPSCPWWDPTCVTCKDGVGSPGCEQPSPRNGSGSGSGWGDCIDDGSGQGTCKVPPGCKPNDPSCDPNCKRKCCGAAAQGT